MSLQSHIIDDDCAMGSCGYPGCYEAVFGRPSKIEILSGTVPAQGGPKPTRVHMDEVELLDPDIWPEARSIKP